MNDANLDNCADEPIHIPGAIQPHGLLLVCRESDLQVTAVSANVVAFLGKPLQAVLGGAVTALFDLPSRAWVLSAAKEPVLRAVNPLRLSTEDGRAFEAVLHRPPGTAGLLVIELEVSSFDYGSGGPSFDPRLRSAIARLQSAHDEPTLNQLAVEGMRTLTGFDRVMVYEFDANWNGVVVAETRRDDLDSLLGQHYPASDIPAQARRLYELNWLRLIADVQYAPAHLVGMESTAGALDMSFAVLRSVSPIHIEYLKNMGVSASMSVSLLRDGKLAGLIACHHYSGPLQVPFAIRETCEYLGQALSWHKEVLRTAAFADCVRRVHEHEAKIVQAVAMQGELLDGLATDSLVALANANGAAVVLGEGLRSVGLVPNTERIAAVVSFLRGQGSDVFVTEKLSEHIPDAAGWEDVASGLLAVAIDPEQGEYLLWFRPTCERVIDWAGNPHHRKLTHGEGTAARLSPRGSFALWRETVRGSSTPWQAWEVEGASSLRRMLLGGIRRRAAELRKLNQRLMEADRAKDNFIATVSHELRSPLNAISGWASLLQRGDLPAGEIAHGLDVIARNVQTQTQLIEDLLDVSRMSSGKMTLDVERVELPWIVRGALDNVALAAEARSVRVSSVLDPLAPQVLGDPGRLRQVVTNLLNNALKFTPTGGSIQVTVRSLAAEVELSVTDTGQGISAAFLPYLFDAFRQEDAAMNRRSKGLGLGLAIVKKIVELHGGTVSAESAGAGLGSTFTVALPFVALRLKDDSEAPPASEQLGAGGELVGLRVLMVEDDADSRELLQRMLERRGSFVTPVSNAELALSLLGTPLHFDIVVSDIGLPDIDGFALIKLIRQKTPEDGGRLPAVALTAYTRTVDRTRALHAGFQAHVSKPVDADELAAVIASLVRRT